MVPWTAISGPVRSLFFLFYPPSLSPWFFFSLGLKQGAALPEQVGFPLNLLLFFWIKLYKKKKRNGLFMCCAHMADALGPLNDLMATPSLHDDDAVLLLRTATSDLDEV